MNNVTLDNESNTNDLIVDNDLILVLKYDGVSVDLNINVMPNTCLRVFDVSKNTHNNITYNIEKNVKVFADKMGIDCNDNLVININDEESVVEFHNSLICYGDDEFKETINHNHSGSKCKIINHALNVKDKEFKFIVDGVIKKEAYDTIFRQDNKIINLHEGKSFILPNLIVDNNDIEASHSAYIGTFDEDDIFYMMSRGIKEKDAEKLLIRAFLINDMELEEKEEEIFDGIINTI